MVEAFHVPPVRVFTQLFFKIEIYWDFPGSPVVGTLPSIAGGASQIPGWTARIPHASRPKNQNRSNIATNSIKV